MSSNSNSAPVFDNGTKPSSSINCTREDLTNVDTYGSGAYTTSLLDNLESESSESSEE